ncbi:MAG: MerR family DNA-binding transcriptional regulator [Betaproteobacteria bacterium]
MAQKSPSGFKIGRLAEATGVHLETIRYYQRLGLMPGSLALHQARAGPRVFAG